jgi:hypothetical protein
MAREWAENRAGGQRHRARDFLDRLTAQAGLGGRREVEVRTEVEVEVPTFLLI